MATTGGTSAQKVENRAGTYSAVSPSAPKAVMAKAMRNMDARASTARLFVFVLCISHTSSLENQKHHKRQSLTENAFVV